MRKTLGYATAVLVSCSLVRATWGEALYMYHEDSHLFREAPKPIETERRCPIVFINRVIKDANESTLPIWDRENKKPFIFDGYFTSPVAKKCAGSMLNSFKSPEDLESVLAKHPMTQIKGSADNFVSQCLRNPKILKKAGLNRPLTLNEQNRVVADYYFTMTRLRKAWDNVSQKVAQTNQLLGRPSLQGIHASEARLPGSTEIVKSLENCKQDRAAIQKIAQDGIARARQVNDKAAQLVAAAAQRGQNISLDQAKALAAIDIPYKSEPRINEILAKVIDGEKVKDKDIVEAYQYDIAAISDQETKTLEYVNQAGACMNSEDPSCFSDAWWQKWNKMFHADWNVHDTVTILSENPALAPQGRQQIPSFDLQGFLAVIRKDPSYGSPGEKTIARKTGNQAANYLSNAQCLSVQREAFDQVKGFVDDQMVNVGFVAASSGVSIATKGLTVGVVPPLVRALNAFQSWKPGLASKVGLARSLAVPTEKMLVTPLAAGKLSTALTRADGAVNTFWLAFGVPMALEGCHKFIEAAQAKTLAALDPACHHDFVSETIQFGDGLGCAMMAGMGGLPLVMHALPHMSGVKNLGPDGFEVTKGVRTMQSIGKSWDPYFVLDVPRGTQDANLIQSKFKEWVKKYHPDLHKNSPEATLAIARINWAKEVLMAKSSKPSEAKPASPISRVISPKKDLK